MIETTTWENVASDPNPSDDLGYELIELDVVRTSVNGDARLLVLPTDENLLREDAFMVADEASVCELESMV